MALFLGITSLLRLLLAASADLKVEEAYYWCYSQHLAPGYFDHPPMVAWLIALFSPLGANSLAVRLPAVLLFAGTGWLLYQTLRRLWDVRSARVGVILHTLMPAFHWYSLLLLPDAPLMFFWTLGIYATTRLLQDEEPRWWWLIGLATGLGMTSKYPAAMIPLAAFLGCWTLRKPKKLCLSRHMFGAAFLALMLFSPVIYWNATHEFASFRFQASERFHESSQQGDKLASLIFPALMLGPGLYLAGPFVLYWAGCMRRSSAVQGLCWTLPFLVLMLWVCSQRLVNINWPLPGYLGFLLLLSPWIAQASWRWFLVVPSAVFSILPLLAMVIPMSLANPGDDINQWRPMARLAMSLRRQMPQPGRTFFLGCGYQASSLITFYGIPKELVTSVNALGMRGLAYDFWNQPEQFEDWDAIIVGYSRVRSNGSWHPQLEIDPKLLQLHFERVDAPVEHVEMRDGQPLRKYTYWKAYRFTSEAIAVKKAADPVEERP